MYLYVCTNAALESPPPLSLWWSLQFKLTHSFFYHPELFSDLETNAKLYRWPADFDHVWLMKKPNTPPPSPTHKRKNPWQCLFSCRCDIDLIGAVCGWGDRQCTGKDVKAAWSQQHRDGERDTVFICCIHWAHCGLAIECFSIGIKIIEGTLFLKNWFCSTDRRDWNKNWFYSTDWRDQNKNWRGKRLFSKLTQYSDEDWERMLL